MTPPQNRPATVQKIAPFVIAGLFGLPLAWIVAVRPDWGGWEFGVLGVCGAILLYALPVCILILIGRPLVMTLAPLLPSAEVRAFHKALRERPPLSDEAFYQRYYAETDVPKAIPIRVRKEIEQALGIDLAGIHPGDNVALADDDLDFGDVLYRLGRVFGIKIPKEACWEEIDGTFDSLVCYVANRLAGE
ncbi:MAG: acyl carrier protein [Planctomycetota bacterium]|jgi:hypothetical protein